jgi:hypothetical protein
VTIAALLVGVLGVAYVLNTGAVNGLEAQVLAFGLLVAVLAVGKYGGLDGATWYQIPFAAIVLAWSGYVLLTNDGDLVMQFFLVALLIQLGWQVSKVASEDSRVDS